MIGFADYLIDAGDVEFVHRIGTGQLGIVHLARNVNTGEEMALKFFDVNILSSAEQKTFLNRVTNLIALKHPAILPITAYMMPTPVQFTESVRSAIGTMYMLKGSLEDIVKYPDAHNLLNGTRKSIIAYGLASAMKFAHMNGIVHHNLKPSNILLDHRYAPKICDFQFLQPPQQFGIRSMNTILFAAPEILRGSSQLNLEADVFSFGMIILYLFMLKLPYDIDAEAINKFVDDVLCGLRPQIPENIPVKIKDLIISCLKQNPEERPTFDQIIELFDSWMIIYPDTNIKEFNAYKAKIHGADLPWSPSKLVSEREELIHMKMEIEEQRKQMETEKAELQRQKNEVIQMKEYLSQMNYELSVSKQMINEENAKIQQEKDQLAKYWNRVNGERNHSFLKSNFDNAASLKSVPVTNHQRRATSITPLMAFADMLEHNKKYQDEKKD